LMFAGATAVAKTAHQLAKDDAYKLGGAAFLIALGVIVAALAFEFIGGYQPCPLCLQQRYAYYLGVPVLFAALVLLSTEQRALSSLIFFLTAIAFLANAGLGTYHAGAEWGFWKGPETCAAGGTASLATSAGDLLAAIEGERTVPCDEVQFRFLGLSFAGWNVLVSLAIMVLALKAAFATQRSKSF